MTLAPTATVDVDGDGRVELLFDHSNDYNAQNATGQPDFIERGIVRLLDGLYLDVSGPTTPILIVPVSCVLTVPLGTAGIATRG